VISNNQILFYDIAGAALSYGIYASGTAEQKNIITGNRIRATVYDAKIDSGDESVVANNHFKGPGFYSSIRVNYYGNTGALLSGASSYYQSNGETDIYYGTAAPVSGTYKQGDILHNVSPVASGFIGFVCVASGTPGTWKPYGPISA
jgi:hypothetical protein